MRKLINSVFILVALVLLLAQIGHACTTFFLDHNGQPVMGTNLDWCYGDGLVIVNKRGLHKIALHNPKKHRNPVRWKSTYGSVTFSIFGREWVWGGMNEAGLACSTMSLEKTKYHSLDKRPSIHPVQYLQYQLDKFSTVEEVIASDSLIRIRPIPKGLGCHYFFCDRFGYCAILEFIKGKLVSYSKHSIPLKALTNDTYKNSLTYSGKFKGLGGKKSIIDNDHSLDRFVRAAYMLKNYEPRTSQSPIDYAFKILESVAMKYTREALNQWGIVYDLGNLRIYFRTRNNRKLRLINLKALPFSCSTPTKVLDIEKKLSGDVTHKFVDYTYQINRRMFETATKKVPYEWNVSEEWLNRIARYPERFRCEE
jgi:penicillin V acylase-like amidase (Ntn superfamily)